MGEVAASWDSDTRTLTVDLKGEPNVLEILYHEDQVAEMFGVTVHTVRYWRREGLIGHVVVNRTVRFTDQQIAEFIHTNTVPMNRQKVS